ncbi:hypothetical protein [Nocardia brasiliensis]|uniref:hypothetical protein n=1 Tax=Nocardia brasiliensis TaxID=37326 RepID=UPI002454E216|nr:hypothetical protein [Nocardia brasiliensis]
MFEVQLGDRFVRGWAATVGEMAELLRRYGVAGSALAGPQVSTVVAPADFDHACDGVLDDHSVQWHARLRSVADGPQRAVLREALSELRARIPAELAELRGWLAEQAAPVNATAPQVGAVAVFEGTGLVRYSTGGGFEAGSQCLAWVDPQAIVSTVDRVWGEFDRSEPHRRSLEGFCTSLRAAGTAAALEAWIDEFVIGRLNQPVRLTRVEGPAGPVYQLRADGTHRAHFARVFGLPLMALVRTSPLPKPLSVIDHPDTPERFGRYASLWSGLREQGLLEVAGDPEPEWFTTWTPTRICAEWMLLPPKEATEVNRAYDRVYPGALQAATGLAAAELFDEGTWARLLLGDGVAVADPARALRSSTPAGSDSGVPRRPVAPGRRDAGRSLGARLRRWVGRGSI